MEDDGDADPELLSGVRPREPLQRVQAESLPGMRVYPQPRLEYRTTDEEESALVFGRPV